MICISPQVMSLSPAPLSLLIKAAPILTEEMYGDIQPAAWELLLSMDEHMAGAAGKETLPGTWCLWPVVTTVLKQRKRHLQLYVRMIEVSRPVNRRVYLRNVFTASFKLCCVFIQDHQISFRVLLL